MSKKRRKLRPDVAETAYRVMMEATGQAPKTVPPNERSKEQRNPEAVARGAKGGKKGGKARAGTLSAETRSAEAARAAKIRWEKR